jgi:hypothetical protein
VEAVSAGSACAPGWQGDLRVWACTRCMSADGAIVRIAVAIWSYSEPVQGPAKQHRRILLSKMLPQQSWCQHGVF